MDNYKIFHPYLGDTLKDGTLEISIESDNLAYSEIGASLYGVQCNSIKNHDEILEKCRQIATLIREVDALNK